MKKKFKIGIGIAIVVIASVLFILYTRLGNTIYYETMCFGFKSMVKIGVSDETCMNIVTNCLIVSQKISRNITKYTFEAGVTADIIKPTEPPRPKGLSATAVWGGGIDGGVYLDYKVIETGKSYYCAIYNDFTGIIDSEGKYTIKRYYWNSRKKERVYLPVKVLPSQLIFTGGGREEIYFEGDYIMIPDGWIYEYFDGKKDHGIKSFYENGKIKIDGQNF